MPMLVGETIADRELDLQWGFHHQDLKVLYAGQVVFNSVTGFIHQDLSPRQVQWLTEHYIKDRMVYSF